MSGTKTPGRCAGVVAAACTQGKRTQHGKPQGVVSDDQPKAREGQAGRTGVAERFVVPLKPGNAGGGKDPDFWCAFEDGEVKVIGDEPAHTDYDPGPSEKAVSSSEGEQAAAQRTLAARAFLRMPHGEASRRAGCRRSARPVR